MRWLLVLLVIFLYGRHDLSSVHWLSGSSMFFAEGATWMYHNKRLEYFGSSKTWSDAKAFCATRSWNGITGKLWTVSSLTESNFVKDRVPNDFYIWTGGNNFDNSNQWVWDENGRLFSDNTPSSPLSDWLYWNTNEPTGDGNCIHVISSGDWKWNDLPCSAKLHFICQYTWDYVDLPGKRVRIYTSGADWATAQGNCNGVTELGVSGRLVLIMSEFENNAVSSLISTRSTTHSHWIGANDLASEGAFQWIGFSGGDTAFSESYFYTAWATSEPNNQGAQEHCVEAGAEGKWNDNICANSFPYLCEFPHTDSASLGNKVFKYFDTLKTWPNAKTACEASTYNGVAGQLAIPNDSTEASYISSLYTSGMSSASVHRAWIGIEPESGTNHKVTLTGLRQYLWGSGCNSDAAYLFCNYQFTPDCAACPVSIFPIGTQDDTLGSTAAPYVCEYVQNNWAEVNGKRYQLSSTKETGDVDACSPLWYDGRQAVRAVISTPEEFEVAYRFMASYGDIVVWSGLTKSSGTWKWANGIPRCDTGAPWCYTWGTAEPSGNGDFSVYVVRTGKLDDVPPSYASYYHLCEFPAARNVSNKIIVTHTAQTVTFGTCTTACETLYKDHRQGRQLAIGNSVEQNLVADIMVNSYPRIAYTGGQLFTNDFKWPNGHVFHIVGGGCQSYCNWMSGEPSGGQIYLQVLDDGYWDDFDGSAYSGMCLCELPVVGRVGNKEFEVISTPETFANAKSMCENLQEVRGSHATIAIIESAEENAMVAELAGSQTVFIGGSDAASEGDWVWDGSYQFSTGSTCGSERYCAWGSGQPSAGAGEHYLTLTAAGEWDDVTDTARSFVCMYIHTATPTFSKSPSSSKTKTPSVSFSSTYPLSSSLSQPTSTTISLSNSISQPLTSSLSLPLSTTGSFTPTITPPPSPTPSDTATSSDSPSVPSTSTLSQTPSDTLTSSDSPSATPTITPPPTPTFSQSFSFSLSMSSSPTLTSTESFSFTKTSSQSHSISSTSSLPLTVTATLSKTYSATETASLEIYCGGLSREYCATVNATCNISSEGSCWARNCGVMESESLCMRMGCQWIPAKRTSIEQWDAHCQKPKECKDIVVLEECQMMMNCRWLHGVCVVDEFPCNLQDSKAACTEAQCSYNDFTTPQCFKTILAPALCRFVETQILCIAQSCLWMDEIDRCEAWNVKCEDVFPTPSNCPLVPNCIYDAVNRVCFGFSDIDFSKSPYPQIVGVSAPTELLPGDAFDISLYGTPIRTERFGSNQVLLLVSFTGNISDMSCPMSIFDQFSQSNGSFSTIVNVSVTYYDADSSASVALDVVVDHVANYTICVKANATHTFGPFSQMEVSIIPPQLDSCVPTPQPPYAGETFEIAIQGRGLDVLGEFLLYRNASLPSDGHCPPYNASEYLTVASHRRTEGTVARYRIAEGEGGTHYVLCYVNRGKNPQPCPSTIEVRAVPPWYDPEVLGEIEASLPTVSTLKVSEFNRQNCRSMQNMNRTGGIFAHPKRMKIDHGDGIHTYYPGEACVFVIKPLSMPQYVFNPAAITLDVYYMSMNKGDETRIFVANSADLFAPPGCPLYKSKKACLKAGCAWADTGECTLEVASSISGCPLGLEGYQLRRALRYQMFEQKEVKTIFLPFDGAIVVTCSDQGQKTGIGSSSIYRVQQTHCISDCKDSKGSTHGECTQKLSDLSWYCKCNPGFAGEDCSRKSTCTGTGLQASALKAPQFDEQLQLKSDPCALVVEVDPTQTTHSGMEKYAMGLSISQLKLSRNDCTKSYILLRSYSHSGRLLKRICRSHLTGVEEELSTSNAAASILNASSATYEREIFRALVEEKKVYIEFRSDEGDYFQLKFQPVSLVCPGRAGRAGIPETQDEICSGHGSCLPIDFLSTESMINSAFQCDCDIPYAASFPGETCNTCAFGYQKQTFPDCSPATICARNCSYNGRCLRGVGCLCNSSFYGVDCQLLDDNERLGSLKSELEFRVPLNNDDAGNVVKSGGIDRTFLPCALPGTVIPCKSEVRNRGRQYKSESSFKGILRRRQVNSTETGQPTSVSKEDIGIVFNELAIDNLFPDYVRTDNVSETPLDMHTDFTVSSWVRVTSLTNGFLFSKVDSVFFADGRSVVLEAAATDVDDRGTPVDRLKLSELSYSVYAGIFLNGDRKRVDLIVTDPSQRHVAFQDHAEKEKWLYVRHFRLGKAAGHLFDNTWRFFTIRMKSAFFRKEGQCFLDGETKTGDSAYVQCLPFLPLATRHVSPSEGVANTAGSASSNTTNATTNSPTQAATIQESTSTSGRLIRSIAIFHGASVLWGYRVQGSLDELHAYSTSLSQRQIVTVGGDLFLGIIGVDTAIAIAMLVLGCVGVLCILLGTGYLVKTSSTSETEASSPNGKDQQRETDGELFQSPIEGEQKHETQSDVQESNSEAKDKEDEKEESRVQPEKEETGNGDSNLVETKIDVNPLVRSTISVNEVNIMNSPEEEMFLTMEKPNKKEQQSDMDNKVALDEFITEVNELKKEVHEAESTLSELKEKTVEAIVAGAHPPAETTVIDMKVEKEVVNEDEAEMEELGFGDWSIDHLRILVDIQKLIAKEQLMKNKKKNKVQGDAGDGRVGKTSADSNAVPSASTGGTVLSLTADSIQILGQIAITIDVPVSFRNIIGPVALFINIDFASAFDIKFVVMYSILVGITMMLWIAVMVIYCREKGVPHSELQQHLEEVRAERMQCLADEEEYAPAAQRLEKLMLVAMLLLATLYIPVTQQSLIVIFCHRQILCTYDCYHDAEHNALIIIACCCLFLVTICVPLLFGRLVMKAVLQYHAFVGSFDLSEEHVRLRSRFWKPFVHTVRTPFSQLYDKLRYDNTSFEVYRLVVKAALCIIVVGMTPESMGQFSVIVCVNLLYSIYVVVTKPYNALAPNAVLAIAQGMVLVILACISAAMIAPEQASAVSVLMIVLVFVGGALIVLAYKCFQFKSS